MSDIIVDSCVLAKWVLAEPDSPKALALMSHALAFGHRLVALDLALPEVGNAIWKRHRQGMLSFDEARHRLLELLRSPVAVEPALPLMGRALEIAMRYDRAVYDALFIALAEMLDAEGVTADEPLVRVVGADFPRIVLLRDT